MKKGDTLGFFKLHAPIGSGGFGSVWMVLSTEDDNYYAMKTEPQNAKRRTLQFEVSVLKKLQGNDRFPKFTFDGKDKDLFYLIMELLGPNLATIAARMPERKFTLPYIPTLTHELLCILEAFHARGYVHRDIKPQNFVTRVSGSAPIVLIDFGVSKVYLDAQRKHLEQKEHGPAIGSPLYSSPNAHRHMDLSRRDDLYSLMYTILDLAGMKLPWKGCANPMDACQIKIDSSLSALLAQISPSFEAIGKHIEDLGFADSPNYALMKELCMKDVTPEPVPYEWMTVKAKEAKFERVAKAAKNEFDPTGVLLELAPHIMPEVTNKTGAGGSCEVQ